MRSLWVAVGNVITGRAVKHCRFLRHHADLAAQAFLGHAAQILTIDHNRAILGIVYPQKQRDERRFARARGADDPELLTRMHRKVHTIKATLPAAIFETDIFKFDLGFCHDQLFCIHRINQRMRGA